MPRHPRLFIPGATYHVYCRVARGEFVFDDDFEAFEFVETLREVRDLDGWTVLAWCLMGNHYHLVVKTRTVDLWRSMARLQGRVSRSHNRRHRFLGRLRWTPANHVDEIATVDQHPETEKFDGQRLAEERAQLDLLEFADRFESASGYDLGELASRHRSMRHITGRTVFCVLAVSRYGLRACDIAALLRKGRNSVTRWLNQGLRRENDDPGFVARLDSLDSAISRR